MREATEIEKLLEKMRQLEEEVRLLRMPAVPDNQHISANECLRLAKEKFIESRFWLEELEEIT